MPGQLIQAIEHVRANLYVHRDILRRRINGGPTAGLRAWRVRHRAFPRVPIVARSLQDAALSCQDAARTGPRPRPLDTDFGDISGGF